MNLVANISQIATGILHIATNILHVNADILYLTLDTLHSIVDAHYLPINAVRHLQLLRRCHPCLFLCQFVQPLYAVLDFSLSRQLPKVLF